MAESHSREFPPGALVWLKIRGWPLWPCQVCDVALVPAHVIAAKCVMRPFLVYSFGDHKYVWTTLASVTAFDHAAAEAAVETSNRLLKTALAEALSASRGSRTNACPTGPANNEVSPSVPQNDPVPASVSPPTALSDRPSGHLRSRENRLAERESRPVECDTRPTDRATTPAPKKRRTYEAAGLFVEIPPELANGNVSLRAEDLLRARACAYSLFSVLDEMLRPYESGELAPLPARAREASQPARAAGAPGG